MMLKTSFRISKFQSLLTIWVEVQVKFCCFDNLETDAEVILNTICPGILKTNVEKNLFTI